MSERLRPYRLRQRSASFKQRKQDYVQATNFLLGGNCCDPLNLSSIDPNEPNQKTPVCSPAPTPYHNKEIDILIPADVNDPLKLNATDCEIKTSSELCHLLISPNKLKQRSTKRRRTESDSIVSELVKEDAFKRMKVDVKAVTVKEPIQSSIDRYHGSVHLTVNYSKRNSTNKDSNCKSTVNTASITFHHPQQPSKQQIEPQVNKMKNMNNKKPFIFQSNQEQFYYAKGRKFNLKDQKFQFGNYNRYYGYRNQNQESDPRLAEFKREWFEGKTVLDVGCNVGFVTCQLAKDFKPKKIVGLDIDGELIKSAKRNIAHYVENRPQKEVNNKKSDNFPVSLSICHGPLSETNKDDDNKLAKECTDDDKLKEESVDHFPNNIQFVAANYVLPNDRLLSTQKAEYDCILCLSVTKWVHLNFGDNGLMRMFKRMHKQLKPNGILILEPQPIWSYERKKALTETTLKNYNSIKFKPDQFKNYLLSDEVGFTSCDSIDPTNQKSKGFQRPIFIFHK